MTSTCRCRISSAHSTGCAGSWPRERYARSMTPEERDRHRKGPVTLRGAQRPDRTTAQRLLGEHGLTAWLPAVPWRVMRIQFEFVEGFGALAELGPAISISGSARLREDRAYYGCAMEIAKGVVEMGYAVITGGGPGI